MGSKAATTTKNESHELILTEEALKDNFIPKHDFPQPIGSPPKIKLETEQRP